jgi:hypothetical protein
VEQDPKTVDAVRDVDVAPELANAIKRYIAGQHFKKSTYPFQTSRGEPLSQRNVLRDSLHSILRKMGISLPYQLILQYRNHMQKAAAIIRRRGGAGEALIARLSALAGEFSRTPFLGRSRPLTGSAVTSGLRSSRLAH